MLVVATAACALLFKRAAWLNQNASRKLHHTKTGRRLLQDYFGRPTLLTPNLLDAHKPHATALSVSWFESLGWGVLCLVTVHFSCSGSFI